MLSPSGIYFWLISNNKKQIWFGRKLVLWNFQLWPHKSGFIIILFGDRRFLMVGLV